MAFLRLGFIRESKTGNINTGLYDAIAYIFNEKKTEGKYVGGYNLIVDMQNSTESAYKQMLDTKRLFDKLDKRQAYHYKLSFPSNDDVSPEQVMNITDELCSRCFSNYECAYSVHTNTEHLHSHIVFNSVGFDGYKYRYEKGDWQRYIQPVVNDICMKYGLSGLDLDVDENLKLNYRSKKNMNYNSWMKNKGTKVQSSEYTNAMIKKDLDECIAAAHSYDEFVRLMTEKGHVYDDSHKYITVKAPGRKRPARIINFTSDKSTYTKENITNMIKGIYLDREEVVKRLFADWNEYNSTIKVRFMKHYSIDIFRLNEEIELITDNDINDKKELAEYAAYISAADKELNIIRKKINISLERHEAAYKALDELLDNYEGFVRYKSGDVRCKEAYDTCMVAYRELSRYDIKRLYEYREKAQEVITQIDYYKKHVYVNKKIVKRIQSKIK